MSIGTLAILAATIPIATIAGAGLSVAFGILVGRIPLNGLLSDSFDKSPSIARMQALVLSIAAAGTYVGLAIAQLVNGGSAMALPEVPSWLITIAGTSHLGYLGSKAWSATVTLKGGES